MTWESVKQDNRSPIRDPVSPPDVLGATSSRTGTPYIRPETQTAEALLRKELPEPRWAVEGILPSGLSILAGRPKTGKSWLALNVALSIASGGRALSNVPVEQGEVLYLALEDTERRLQDRLRILLAEEAAPAALHLSTAWPRLGAGATEELRTWLEAHTQTRLVVADTLGKIRGQGGRSDNAYAVDYQAMGSLKDVADEFKIALVVVHHQRKADAADALDSVSGTTALTGSADTTLVLKRARGSADAELLVTGRDVPEQELALQWDDALCIWVLKGTAQEARLSNERREILAAIREAGEAQAPKALALMLDKKEGAIRRLVTKMAADGELNALGGGLYDLPLSTSNRGNDD